MLLGSLILTGIVFSGFGRRSIVIAYDTASRQEIEGNPLAVASFAGYVVVCCVFSIYANKTNIFSRALKIALVLLSLYIIVRSGSRGQLVGVVLACLFWLPITMKVAMKKSTIIPLVFAGILFASSAYFIGNESDLLWRWQSERLQGDQIGRLERANLMIQHAVGKGPLTWIGGLGSSSSFALVGGYPHFVPGEVLAEEGIAGAILFFGFLFTAALAGWRTINTPDLPAQTRLNMGALMTIFTYQFILCLKQGSLLGSPELFSLGLCVSLVALGVKDRIRRLQRLQMARPLPAFGP
jgi:O-antigen ligase